uniref:Uncharacterized protein n=1 Tax=Desertifilum tharense IPPAS B-1220 TaxID=1781255 RepID=A0ACD5GPF0_9CYAN
MGVGGNWGIQVFEINSENSLICSLRDREAQSSPQHSLLPILLRTHFPLSILFPHLPILLPLGTRNSELGTHFPLSTFYSALRRGSQ